MTRLPAPAALLAAMLSCTLLLPGCAREKLGPAVAAPPASPFQGPRPLRGTIGSYARLSGGNELLVSGYGLVVNLDETGTAVVPEFLRGWLGNEMRKRGVGSRELSDRNPELAAISPERLQLSTQTATVRVSGLIPPGATPGTPFDVLLEALPEDTDTTSLAGGQLWQTTLGVGGANRRLAFATPLAAGFGPVYLSPTAAAGEVEPTGSDAPVLLSGDAGVDPALPAAQATRGRRAVVVGGGRATEPRRLELILYQPSWPNARRISDTINERYRAGGSARAGAVRPTANAVSDSVIQLSIPERFAGNPADLLVLIENTYPYPVDRAETVDRMMSLIANPAADPELLRRAPLVCRALGPNAVGAVQRHYASDDARVRLAALTTGAWLTDAGAVPGLIALAADRAADAEARAAAARALASMPDNVRATDGLAALLDDPERPVRVAAYEAAAAAGSPLVDRLAVTNLDGVKFLIDRVPAENPLVMAIPRGTPRLVIFGPQTGFRTPVFDAGDGLLIRTPTRFGQALDGLRDGDTAFLPAATRTATRTGPEGPVAEALDGGGDAVTLALVDPAAAEAFEGALPLAGGGAAGHSLVTLRCRVVNAERQTLELLGVQPGLDAMPLSVFSRAGGPRGAEPRSERVTPTVAALSYYLAHRPTMRAPQEGLDLTFGRTVAVLDRLSRGGALPAPLALLENPLAAEIAAAEAAAGDAGRGRSLTADAAPTGRADTAGG